MDLSCSRQPPVIEPSRGFLVSLFFCLWSAPLSGESGDMSCHSTVHCCTHSSGRAHKHLKDHWVTQNDIHTTPGCTFVFEGIHAWRSTRRPTDRGMCAHTDTWCTYRAKLEGRLKVDCEITDWQAAELTAVTIQNIRGTRSQACFDWWASVAYSLTWCMMTVKQGVTRKEHESSADFLSWIKVTVIQPSIHFFQKIHTPRYRNLRKVIFSNHRHVRCFTLPMWFAQASIKGRNQLDRSVLIQK